MNNYGKVYDKNSLFMCIEVGEAKGGELEYEIFTNMNQSPLIKSKQTGKYFSLSWQDLIEMAQGAGIDQ